MSPDGKTVALQVTVPRMGPDVWTVAWGDPASARALVSTAAREGTSSFSPDGRFLAYDSNDSGRPEVYVRALHGDAPRRQVSNRGGSAPHWVRSTGEILYLSWSPPRRMIMSASVATNSDLRIQEPREICEIPPSIRLVSRFLDTTADGQRFLMVQTLDERPAQVVVIPDFREELEARLAATPR